MKKKKENKEKEREQKKRTKQRSHVFIHSCTLTTLHHTFHKERGKLFEKSLRRKRSCEKAAFYKTMVEPKDNVHFIHP